jgi:hypothetical protein
MCYIALLGEFSLKNHNPHVFIVILHLLLGTHKWLFKTLTLAKIVSCVPANNFDPAAAPVACRRKRSDENNSDTQEDQFPIAPSITLG